MAFVYSVAVNWIYLILYAYCFLVVCSIPSVSCTDIAYLCHLMCVRIDKLIFEVGLGEIRLHIKVRIGIIEFWDWIGLEF